MLGESIIINTAFVKQMLAGFLSEIDDQDS